MGGTSRGEARLLLLPLVLFLVLLLGFPFLANLGWSFADFSFATLWQPRFVGPGNYLAAATNPAFWEAVWFSVRFALLTATAEVALGLALALAVAPLVEKRPCLLAPLLLPMMISPALMGVMWRLMLNEFVGVIPQYLSMLGILIDPLGPDWVVTTLVVIEILQWTPFAFLILVTALQAIPGELLEAAAIDGAGRAQRLLRIVLPLLVPALAITAFLRFIDGARVFDHIYVLTGGGPGTMTTSVSIHVYKSFFQQDRLGEAVATAMLLFVLAALLLIPMMRFGLRGART
ncbi:MAG: sugar ABC transporter permease [Geminicoccaceae bacterium]